MNLNLGEELERAVAYTAEQRGQRSTEWLRGKLVQALDDGSATLKLSIPPAGWIPKANREYKPGPPTVVVPQPTELLDAAGVVVTPSVITVSKDGVKTVTAPTINDDEQV